MTELTFKGKEFVYNHHLAVPFRPLEPRARKGIGKPSIDGNLIIHGDNLHALKSLLPMYAGKVDCIFIDPPYNTGNEGWCYSDNVNAPMIREWFNSNPVGIEDSLRHDKWCAMMWPRLKLLRELMSSIGSIWIAIDNNEVHRAQLMLDEVFGEENFVAKFVVVNNLKGRNDKEHISLTHEYMLVYSNDEYLSSGIDLSKEQISEFEHQDKHGNYQLRDLRKRGAEDKKEDRESMYFPIFWDEATGMVSLERKSKSQVEIFPLLGNGEDGRWRWGPDRVSQNLDILVPKKSSTGRYDVSYKVYLSNLESGEEIKRRPKSFWTGSEFSTDVATRTLKQIFGGKNPFSHSPKSLEHVRRCIEISTTKNSLILDSFAGSGTTAHAVLEANKKDGGNRRFILVEMEDYADKVTAERVRRVIKGYDFKGTQKTELLRERITWSKLQKAEKITEAVQAIENLHGHEYDKISKTVKDGELIVTGEKSVKERAEGLGGSFTYCTLGDPVELDKILSGKSLPTWESLGKILFHMATNKVIDTKKVRKRDFYLGEADGQHIWLIYKPQLEWLKSPDSALTLSRAKSFAKTDQKSKHLVIAPARYVSQKMLAEENIPVEFVPLPFALYRIEGS